MNGKVINIIPHVPNYGAYEGSPKPSLHWDQEDGSWVGIWGYDWPDLLGNEVLKVRNQIDFQVWQPDHRAQKVYEARLESGGLHKLFPAGKGDGETFRSDSMMDALEQELRQGAVLNLNDLDSAFEILTELTVRGFSPNEFPVVLTCHGSTRMPIGRLKKLKRFWRVSAILNLHRQYKKMLKQVDVITEQHDYGIREYRKYFDGTIVKTTMGCDFDFWKPQPQGFDKHSLARKMGIEGKKIFFNACNFSPVKQLDRLIQGFAALTERDDYFLLLVGHGAQEYEAYLKKVAEPLIKSGRMAFLPYTRGEALRELYWSADYFINTSVTEGGPVSVFQALACGMNVIATDTGAGADFLKEHDCGYVLPVHSSDHWTHHLEKILTGTQVKTAPVDQAFDRFGWPKVAERFIDIYDTLWQKYEAKTGSSSPGGDR